MHHLIGELKDLSSQIAEEEERYYESVPNPTHFDYCSYGFSVDEKNKTITIFDDNVTGFAHMGRNTIKELDLILGTKDGWKIKVNVNKAGGLVGKDFWSRAAPIIKKSLKDEDVAFCRYTEAIDGEVVYDDWPCKLDEIDSLP